MNCSTSSSELSAEEMTIPEKSNLTKDDIKNLGHQLFRRINKIKKYKKKGVIRGINDYFDDHLSNKPSQHLPMIKRVAQVSYNS